MGENKAVSDINLGQSRCVVNVEPSVRTGRTVPAGERVYAIGDLHGQFDLLEAMSAVILHLETILPAKRSRQVFLGDYVDRGPDTASVIEWLVNAPSAIERVCLCGNHEALMLGYLESPEALDAWRSVGGGDTLASYGISRRLQGDRASRTRMWREFKLTFPAQHRQFLSELHTVYQVGEYIFAHAGLRPGVPLGQQSVRDLLWIRSEFLDSEAEFEGMVVHGHSPARDVVFRRNRIGVDTGAYVTRVLSCVMLEADEATVIQVRPRGAV